MKRILGAILSLLASVAQLAVMRRRSKPEREAQKAVGDAREAVADGDEAGLNRMLEEARIRRATDGKRGTACVRALACLCGAALVAAALAGCATRTLVVPADRAVRAAEMEGVRGWFVPAATMADLVEAYVNTRKGDVE